MRKASVVLVLLVLASLACTLSNKNESANTVLIPTNTPFIVTSTPQAGVTPTATIRPTNTPVTGGSSGNSGNGSPPCVIQSSWPIYIVQSGDTLGQIAQRTGSTINALVSANCLANANVLSVGQSLRVPRQPTLPTATATQNSTVPQVGFVNVSHYLGGDGGSLILDPGRIVTLSWSEAPRNAAAVYFILIPSGVPSDGGDVGADTNLADGAAISWQVSPHLAHSLMARAIRADGTTMQVTYITGIYSGNALPPNDCVIRNMAGMPANIYSQPSESANVFGQLMPFDFVGVVGKTNDGWIGVFPAAAQAGAYGIYRIKWVRQIDSTSLLGPCANVQSIPINVSSTGCFMAAAAGTNVNLYNQPNIYETPFGVLTADVTVEVLLQTTDGWYAVETGTPQAGSVGAYRLKWVPTSSSTTLSGTCTAIPQLAWNAQ